ncbi:unnamed protein product [Phaedon cochleariae]|uniref:Sodium/potassium-transporting ATPase subunit beta-1-interacting protein n=1 Tax=Phaedon cochleariae TaxID=80249 RepID=A0A9N9SE24_PHACE|nr:unnamed protein product [Phaedon cochleariae]
MGICTRRFFFLSVCLLQMVSTVERQVFDFLGFLWIPILVNFFEIIFIIFGFFGAYQYRMKYMIAYLIWHIFWIGWNVFLICLYLNVAGLDHEKNKVLKLDLNSDSWWKKEGPGCKIKNVDAVPVEYEGCLINYIDVEIVQAGMQCFFALFNCFIGMCLSRSFIDEDDTFDYEKPCAPGSIPLHPTYVTSDNLQSSNNFLHKSNVYLFDSLGKYPKKRNIPVDKIRNPKRRSNSFSTTYITASRKSIRKNSKQRTSLYSIEFSSHLERHNDSDTEFEQAPPPMSPKPMTPRRVKRRSVMTRGSSGRQSTSSRRHSQGRSSTRSSRRNPVTQLMEQQRKAQPYDSPASPSPIDSSSPNYFTTSNNNLVTHQNWHVPNGHTNPTYQQSSQQSLNETEELDELYNNRPASVRSSYSNFHGTRTLNNYSPTKNYHSHSHATPQVPQKRNHPNRHSMRSMAFLNNGPPAYSSQGHIALDSETPM